MHFPAFSLGSPELWNDVGMAILAVITLIGLCVTTFLAIEAMPPLARVLVALAVFFATPNQHLLIPIIVGVLGFVVWAWRQGRYAKCHCGKVVTFSGDHCPCGSPKPS